MARVKREIPDTRRDEWDAFVDWSGEVRSRADSIRPAEARYIATDGDSETDRLNDDVTRICEQVTEVLGLVRHVVWFVPLLA